MLSVRRFLRFLIQWTLNSNARPIQHLRVNHCRTDILVPQQFLHGSNIIAASEQLRRERMPQAMTIGTFHDSGRVHSTFQCALQKAFSHVMALSFSPARIN